MTTTSLLRRTAISFLLAGIVLALAATAKAAGGYYGIVNVGSGMCAEVNRFGNPYANGELVVQRACDGALEQQWAPVVVGGSVYELVNARSGLCMDVRDGINADRTPIQQWGCTGTTSMKWTFNPNSFTGVHQIKSQIGRRCLDVRGGSLEDGAQIQIYRCTGFGNPAQVWSFSG